MSDNIRLLRHTLATLAYRGAKVVRDAPEGFAATRACPTCRSAGEILAHICDLLDWAATAVRGRAQWHAQPPQSWNDDVARFFCALETLDESLVSTIELPYPTEKLFQGPIADALTHVGQLATLRRIAGAPVRGENYFIADITVGHVSADQPPPQREFD